MDEYDYIIFCIFELPSWSTLWSGGTILFVRDVAGSNRDRQGKYSGSNALCRREGSRIICRYLLGLASLFYPLIVLPFTYGLMNMQR